MKASVVVCTRRTTDSHFLTGRKTTPTAWEESCGRRTSKDRKMTAARREGKHYTGFVFRFRFFCQIQRSQTNNMTAVFSALATSQICSTISNVTAKCSKTTAVVASLHFIIYSSILYFFLWNFVFRVQRQMLRLSQKPGEFPLLTKADVPVLYQAPKYFGYFSFCS